MATKDDFEKTGAAAQLHKIRITLTSRNVANLEKCEFALTSVNYGLGG